MDWKIFSSTFITIFLAEMGDKTQFAAMAVSAQTKSTWSVALAVIIALILAGLIGVIAGKLLGSFINPQIMKYISGSLFIVMGAWIIIK
jgi:putative Ca2+/H+ antiporter (TMEM165/GDT1 family)